MDGDTHSLGRVMLVDDELVDRLMGQRLIQRLKISDELHCFANAETALEALTTNSLAADVILVDVNMPRLSGIEFTKAISDLEKSRFCGAVAIMVSTKLTQNMRTEFNRFSCVRTFIDKPLTKNSLVEMTQFLRRNNKAN